MKYFFFFGLFSLTTDKTFFFFNFYNPVKEQEPENWIQCEHDTCMKWRKIPMEVDVETLPEPWYCSMNQWDSSKCTCNAIEETWDTNALDDYNYKKEEIQILKQGEKIDLFCTNKGGWSEAKVMETRTKEDENATMEVHCHYLVRLDI